MTKFGGLVAFMVVLAAASARSQDADNSVFADTQPEESAPASASDAPAPAPRYYSRERSHYDKSKSPAHFSRAEFEANERTRRLAAMRWYGVSNARPVVSPTPWYGTYSPTWTSGGVDPFRWQDPAMAPANYFYNGTYYGRPLAPQYYLLGY